MFNNKVDYPTGVASYNEQGIDAAIDWCCEHMEDGDTLTVWTALKSNLENCSQLEQFVNRYSDVKHVTGRGGGFIGSPGPVLMAWANMDDIGKLVEYSSHHIRALCIITSNERALRPWVSAAQAAILGDSSAWNKPAPQLDPVVIEAMKSLTLTVNHNNTISAGYEKDQVVSTLLILHDAGIRMNGAAIQGWALAHGWSGDNPARLAEYVKDINAGKRPRCKRVLDQGYIELLRRRAAEENS